MTALGTLPQNSIGQGAKAAANKAKIGFPSHRLAAAVVFN
jgi:hypothetical protein